MSPRDVPALVCDACGEVKYALEVSREIDRVRRDFFVGRLRVLRAAAEIAFGPQSADSIV